MKAIIDEAFANRRADVVWIICLSIFIAFVLRGFASYGQAVALSKIGNNIVARYQRRLYAHLMTLSVGFFSEARSAHIAAQVSQNVSGIRDVLNLTVTSTARDLLTFVSLIGVMIIQDPLLSLAVFILAPPLLYGLRYLSKRLRSGDHAKPIDLNSHVLGAMQETIQGITIVKAFTMEDELERKVNKLIAACRKPRKPDRPPFRTHRADDGNLRRLCRCQRACLCRLPVDLPQRAAGRLLLLRHGAAARLRSGPTPCKTAGPAGARRRQCADDLRTARYGAASARPAGCQASGGDECPHRIPQRLFRLRQATRSSTA